MDCQGYNKKAGRGGIRTGFFVLLYSIALGRKEIETSLPQPASMDLILPTAMVG